MADEDFDTFYRLPVLDPKVIKYYFAYRAPLTVGARVPTRSRTSSDAGRTRTAGRRCSAPPARSSEPTLLGVSAHLLAAGRRPGLARFTAPCASG